MTAYIVATRQCTRDEVELDAYKTKAVQAVTPEMVLLATGGSFEVLEGGSHQGIVILAFPDRAAALNWYFSEAYQEARQHRLNGADYQITLVEGWADSQ